MRNTKMLSVVAAFLAATVLMMTIPALAIKLDDTQAATVAEECLKIGKLCGGMETGKKLMTGTAIGEAKYNEMVDLANPVIEKHNALMMLMFSDDPSKLRELLLPEFEYI